MARTVKRQQDTALLLGCGYVAKAMIEPLLARGFHVIGTGRSAESCAQISNLGAKAIQFEKALNPELRLALETATHIMSSIPPQQSRDPFLSALMGPLKSLAPHVRYSAYLSATSVYGDRDGQWAYEDELLRPKLARGVARVKAELSWLESDACAHIFRLAGIYGPGRSPFEKIISEQARAVIKHGHVVNRIHRDDIVSALLLSIDRPDPGQVYNLADSHPAPPQDVLDFAADLIGAKRPLRVDHDAAQISDMARSFYTETKRINSDRAITRLGWSARYADYRSGLRAIALHDNVPSQGVTLSGHMLVPQEGRASLDRALPKHILLSKAEVGCLEFQVTPHPEHVGRYDVYERFDSQESFKAHQARIEGSLWQSVSRNTERRYMINGAQL